MRDMQIAINISKPDSYISVAHRHESYTLTKLSELCFTLQSSEAWRIEGFLDRFHGIIASIFTPIRAILLSAPCGYDEGRGISRAETGPKNLRGNDGSPVRMGSE